MKTLYQELLETARRAARAGSEALVPLFRRADLEVSLKRRNDFISEADRASEEVIVREIRRAFPDHRILAEEGGVHQQGEGSGFEWILDPLDGTTNFVHGHPVWAVSVACRVDGELAVGVISEPLAGNELAAASGCGARWNDRPMRVRERGLDGAFLATGFPFRAHPAVDTYLAAFRDVFLRAGAIRRCGAAALDLAYTAAGIYDGFFELRLSPWDVAAGAVLVREAGGTVSDFDGGDGFLGSGNVVAGSPALHAELLGVLRRHLSEAIIEQLVPQSEVDGRAYTHTQEHARVDGS